MMSTLAAPVLNDNLPLAALSRCGILCLETARPQIPDLMAGLASAALGREAPIYCLDGANCFDPYPMAARARAWGRRERELLARVFVSRAFTIHQLQAAAREMLRPLAAQDPPPMIAVLGAEHLFLEESLPQWERRHVMGEILEDFAALRAAQTPLVLTHEPPLSARKEPWWRPMLHRVSDLRGIVSEGQGGCLNIEIQESDQRQLPKR